MFPIEPFFLPRIHDAVFGRVTINRLRFYEEELVSNMIVS